MGRVRELEVIPARLVVLGGGPIGCELTQAFARLGARVTQVQNGPRLLPARTMRCPVRWNALRSDGAESRLARGREVRSGGRSGSSCSTSGGEIRVEIDQLILAVGRSARLAGYGLEDLGIETSRTVVTNEYLETLYPNIFAAGDVRAPISSPTPRGIRPGTPR